MFILTSQTLFFLGDLHGSDFVENILHDYLALPVILIILNVHPIPNGSKLNYLCKGMVQH